MTKTQAHKFPPQEKPRRDIVVVPRPIPLSSTNTCTHARTHARTRNPHPGPVRPPPPPPPVRAHTLPSLPLSPLSPQFPLLRPLASSFGHGPISPRRCIVPTYLPTYQPSRPFVGLPAGSHRNQPRPPTQLTYTHTPAAADASALVDPHNLLPFFFPFFFDSRPFRPCDPAQKEQVVTRSVQGIGSRLRSVVLFLETIRYVAAFFWPHRGRGGEIV